jgi:hypothetical protein
MELENTSVICIGGHIVHADNRLIRPHLPSDEQTLAIYLDRAAKSVLARGYDNSIFVRCISDSVLDVGELLRDT